MILMVPVNAVMAMKTKTYQVGCLLPQGSEWGSCRGLSIWVLAEFFTDPRRVLSPACLFESSEELSEMLMPGLHFWDSGSFHVGETPSISF